jgi:hypothetical protein
MVGRVLLLAGVLISVVSLQGTAELQNVEVGGSIEVFAGWYSEFFEVNPVPRYPAVFLPGRPIGPNGTLSIIRSDGGGNGVTFVEQRTRLHVDAGFTDDVKAFIEVDAIDDWGTDFRSNYVTGADTRGVTNDDVEVFQAYVEANDVLGAPLRLRVGRQEITLGSGWLVGSNPNANPFTGLSFDAVRLTYAADKYSLDAWWAKLLERSPLEGDGDVDFYGVYVTWTPVEDVAFDAYWMYVRDAAAIEDQNLSLPGEWMERRVGLDDYGVTGLHTIGFRNAGTRAAFDWEVEVAYQFGNADAAGALFTSPFLPLGALAYGDDHASWDSWGGHFEVGYTFEAVWQPRVYLAGYYYDGEDNRGLSFWDWLNPFHKPDASISFNRLFSDHEIDWFLCTSALTNSWELAGGVSVTPVEKLELTFDVTYQEIVAPFDYPPYFEVGPWRIPVLPGLSFWTEEGDDDLGWQTSLTLSYAYTEEVSFEAGWTHFFVGEGLKDGAFIDENGLTFLGGRGDHDADFVRSYVVIEF